MKITDPKVLDACEAKGSSHTHPTTRDKEFSLLPEINHVVFVLLYLINIFLIKK